MIKKAGGEGGNRNRKKGEASGKTQNFNRNHQTLANSVEEVLLRGLLGAFAADALFDQKKCRVGASAGEMKKSRDLDQPSIWYSRCHCCYRREDGLFATNGVSVGATMVGVLAASAATVVPV